MAWQKDMTALTSGLAHVGLVGLSGCSPRDPPLIKLHMRTMANRA